MTTAPDALRDDDPVTPSDPGAPPGRRPRLPRSRLLRARLLAAAGAAGQAGRPRTPRTLWALWAAGVAGVLAALCGVLLPFAPVVVNTPTVTWPRDPARAESTLLPLTAYRPLGLDVRFTCDVVRLAAGAPDVTGGTGTVLATAVPGSGQAATAALLVTATGDRVQVRARGAVVLDEPVPGGPCAYRIAGRDAGLPRDVRGPPAPVTGFDPGVPVERVPPAVGDVAAAGSAELVVTRDGAVVGRIDGSRLPDVDVLVSALTDLPPAGLAVTLRVDDESATAPTPFKTALTVVLVLALLATALLLVLVDRAVRCPAPRWPRRPGTAVLVDVAVAAVLGLWTFVAPATDDDGYFATQARNAARAGGVGDYFSFGNRSFTPFTWPYEALAAWQQLVGVAPVLQRVPAAVCGLLTWLVASRLAAAVHRPGAAVGSAAVRGTAVRGAVAIAFLAWWLPYAMGVRPEAVVALCAVVVAAALLAAARGRRLAVAWLGLAAAGAGAAAHTGGVVVLGVVLAGLPLLAGLLRTPASGSVEGGAAHGVAPVLRLAAVGSGAAVGLLLGFADGALRDFRRGQAAVAAVLTPDGWADEVGRYAFLLDPIPMGSFAKRAAVLTCLVALAWFGVLAVAARARRVPLPPPLALTGTATALGFAALSLTPSKWTHHFGALAGVGAAFLGLLLVTAVPLTREVLAGGRLPRAVPAVLAGSAATVCALVWHGPNSWAYAVLDGVPSAYVRPVWGGVTADHPAAWLALIAVVALGLTVAGRRVSGAPSSDLRTALLRAVPLVVAVSLAGSATYTVGAFAVAAARGTPPGSLWVEGFADPAGGGCGATEAIRVLDPASAAPLPALSAPGPRDGFAEGSGHFPGDRPPPGAVWGSLTDRPGGSATTAWYALPAPPAPDPAGGSAVAVTAAGDLGDDGGTALTAVFGRRGDGGTAPVGSAVLADGDSSPHWRTFRLEPPPGADAVRLEAVDATAARHGWLAFTAPAVLDAVSLRQLLPPEAPVALGWQLAFAHPCPRLPALVDGITEPPAYAVLRAGAPRTDPDAAPLDALGDIAWQADRGGPFAQVPRSQSVLALATVGSGDPYVRVYAFRTPLARNAYTLVPGTRTVGGADAGVGN